MAPKRNRTREIRRLVFQWNSRAALERERPVSFLLIAKERELSRHSAHYWIGNLPALGIVRVVVAADLKSSHAQFVTIARTLMGYEKRETRAFLERLLRSLDHECAIEAEATFEVRGAKNRNGSGKIFLDAFHMA